MRGRPYVLFCLVGVCFVWCVWGVGGGGGGRWSVVGVGVEGEEKEKEKRNVVGAMLRETKFYLFYLALGFLFHSRSVNIERGEESSLPRGPATAVGGHR